MDYLSQIPLITGSYWKYAIHDYVTATDDTLLETVIGDTIRQNNIKAKIIQRRTYLYNVNSTYYVELGNNELRFYRNYGAPSYYKKYAMPLEAGKDWTNFTYSDTTFIIGQNQVVTSAGNFRAFALHRTAAIPTYSLNDTEYIVPNIGLVQFSLVEPSASIFQSGQLVSYLIK